MNSSLSVGKMADEEEGAPLSDEEMQADGAMSAGSESTGDESEEEELYEVEEIVGMKKNANGVMLYRVRWKNYSKAFDTWEPIENLESCLDMVEEYQLLKNREKKRRSDQRKKRMALMAGRELSQTTSASDSAQLEPPSLSTPEPLSPALSPQEPPPPSAMAAPAELACTLKDTFWKDLEEGRINLFNTDMYSKVKGQGRASRPRSFKKLFSGGKGEQTSTQHSGKGANSDGEANKKHSRSKVKQKHVDKQAKDSFKKRTKSVEGSKSKSRPVKKQAGKRISSVGGSDSSETSSDSSDVVMGTVISTASTPSPPVLSCVEDYSDDSSRDFSDHRYSSPADITGSQSDSQGYSKSAVSEDTGICLEPENSTLHTHQHSQEQSPPLLQTAAVQRSQEDTVMENKSEVDSVKNTPAQPDKVVSNEDKIKSIKTVNNAVSEMKSAKKTKPRSEPSEIHKCVEKKVKLDTDLMKHKPRHRSGPAQKETASHVPSKSQTAPAVRPGKENLGDKQLTNIVSGLSSVLSPSPKSRGPAVPPRGSGRSDQGGVAGVQKRKDPAAPTDLSQPLDKILSSSLLPILPENKSDKGVDLAFDIDLEDIDLDELEKQLTLSPSAQPLEMSDDELRVAVLAGEYELVKRALAARRLYDVEQEDDTGTTLLMHAILSNYDDIAEVLVCSGAKINAQQKNGNTALMIASEQAHICTVALLIEMGARVNLQQTSGETALMKAVRRGHKQIIRYLLESGANFSLLTHSGNSALSYAKMLRYTDIEDIIVEHVSRLTAEFDRQVAITLNNTAQIISALFPLQCFPLAESDKFLISFKNEMEPSTPGVGYLLFIAHARVTSQEVKCRFYGPCAVKSVVLNGVTQPSLTEEANFVLSCHPVLPGKNELCIHTESAVSSKAKLVVCAYKAQLIQ